MNLKTSRNNDDARQNLKVTFRNTDYQSSPKTKAYAEATRQNSQQKNMNQTNTHNMNPQFAVQQRASPQRNQEENNQATIIVPDTQERDDATSEDQYFLFQGPNQTDWGE